MDKGHYHLRVIYCDQHGFCSFWPFNILQAKIIITSIDLADYAFL